MDRSAPPVSDGRVGRAGHRRMQRPLGEEHGRRRVLPPEAAVRKLRRRCADRFSHGEIDIVPRHVQLARGHPDLQQSRIGVDEGGPPETAHDGRRQRVPQIQQEISLCGSAQVQAALGQVEGKRLVAERKERDRIREAVGFESRLQRGKARPRIGAVSPPPRGRFVAEVDPFQPDHAASAGAQTERPVEVDPEMPAALWVFDRLRRCEADRDAHPSPAVHAVSCGSADSNNRCPRAARSAA